MFFHSPHNVLTFSVGSGDGLLLKTFERFIKIPNKNLPLSKFGQYHLFQKLEYLLEFQVFQKRRLLQEMP